MKFHQDGGCFYDENDKLIAQYTDMVKNDHDIKGAAEARKAFLAAHPEYEEPEISADINEISDLLGKCLKAVVQKYREQDLIILIEAHAVGGHVSIATKVYGNAK